MDTNSPNSAKAYHYDTSSEGIGATRRSAAEIVPALASRFSPQSVVDFGCGLGDWLAEFQAHGCTRILGLDGPWVPEAHLQIPASSFKCVELSSEFEVGGTFDLAISFEVAEHLDAKAGDQLVSKMCAAADVVVFGAAIPMQGGHRHVNEQYQSHWIGKFAAFGFTAFDLVRPDIWMNPRCNWWYQQNIFVYANAKAQNRYGLVQSPFIADIVHPRLYDWHRDPLHWGGRDMLKMLKRKLLVKTGFLRV